MIFDKHRFEVWTAAQHPLKHTLSDFAYSNDGLPGVTDVNSALNWVVKVLYPNTKPSVATPGDLPAVGNTLNDYRVVLDDGDGKQAGYRWEQREGEVSASWHKVFDFDWSTDSILAAFMNITQDLYVYKMGKTDLDPAGSPITGIFAGQTVNGGNVASQNLTLRANSGDGVGAHTGFVQVDDHFRATVTNTYDLGTSAIKFKDLWLAGEANIDTVTISTGSITDSTGTIDFDDEDLITTGNITGDSGFFTTQVQVGPLAGNALILAPGSITDDSGAIDFDDEDLTTTGTIDAGAGSVLADITFLDGSIESASGAIDFVANDLTTTGEVTASAFNGGTMNVTSLDVDNINLDGNTISITNSNGNLILTANGTGVVDIQKAMTTLGQTVTGTLAVTGQLNADNLRLDGNVLSATNTNGNVTIQPNGTGVVEVTAGVVPNTDDAYSIGSGILRFSNLFLSDSIQDGTDTITVPTIMSLRDINVGVGAGFSLFWDGTKWVSSLPDTEIVHGDLSGLTTGDAGHTQFALLAGRAGGQALIGGTAASENLSLESTAHATKGSVLTKDHFRPFTNASFSAGWLGTDLGGASNYFRDLYTKGEARGLRFENFTSGTLPASSAQNVGRVVFATDNNKTYIDNGSAFLVLGVSKYLNDTSWDGVATSQTFTVSATISDARTALWQLCDNANDFNRVYCDIKPISATQVSVTASPALPAGSYRLIGIE